MSACAELEMRRMSVKLDQELMKKAKIVAASREQTVIEYLEEMIRPQIQNDLEEEMRKLTARPKAQPPKGGSKS